MELKCMNMDSTRTSCGTAVTMSSTEQRLQIDTRTQPYVRINFLKKNTNDGQK